MPAKRKPSSKEGAQRPSYLKITKIRDENALPKFSPDRHVPLLIYGTQINGDEPHLQSLYQKNLQHSLSTNNLVNLTLDNSEIIEAAIKNDRDYHKDIGKIVFNAFEGSDKKDKNESIFVLLRLIDVSNSTNAWEMCRDDFYCIYKYACDEKDYFSIPLKKGIQAIF